MKLVRNVGGGVTVVKPIENVRGVTVVKPIQDVGGG